MQQSDVTLPDGRVLHLYDESPHRPGPRDIPVFWHHGTPQSGQLPAPLLRAARRHGVRLLSHERPGYGMSTSLPGRDVADVAADVAALADHLRIGRFAVLGASGGGPHALACAAVLGDRVAAVASMASIAPFDADGLDWFAGMDPSGVAEFDAASRGRADLAAHLTREVDVDFSEFAPADLSTFAGPYGEWLVESSAEGLAGGLDGALDDDLAFVAPWGFDLADIATPVCIVHGGADRFVPESHARWLAGRCPDAELRVTPDDGHVSVFEHTEQTFTWLVQHRR
ncbi:MAG: alpha/beta hydrolase [Propionibacteriaceae bacterium]